MRVSRKTYVGVETPLGVQTRVREGGSDDVMDLRFDLVKRQPHEWEDPELGAEQLAMAILADATGNDNYALLRCKQFKDDVTVYLPLEGWRMTWSQVMSWVNTHPLTEDDI